MKSADRTLATVRAWKHRLITAQEASEMVGVSTEAELLAIARAAEAGVAPSFAAAPVNNVHPFPLRRPANPAAASEGADFIRSRR